MAGNEALTPPPPHLPFPLIKIKDTFLVIKLHGSHITVNIKRKISDIFPWQSARAIRKWKSWDNTKNTPPPPPNTVPESLKNWKKWIMNLLLFEYCRIEWDNQKINYDLNWPGGTNKFKRTFSFNIDLQWFNTDDLFLGNPTTNRDGTG